MEIFTPETGSLNFGKEYILAEGSIDPYKAFCYSEF